ncbi:MAG: Lrp/AsnC family transcriptional regulator [Candidatus Omnitrophica bacterium]|nr:Lrp/AsnC family transcriptional regulator [Candidatus Omnitrophota bacterium]
MNAAYTLDEVMKKILFRLQEGLPISPRPYKELADELGLSEEEMVARLSWLQEEGFLKRINFSFDLNKLGVVSTLVGCRIPKKNINMAQKVINAYGNITHNYLRKHRLNMWFTLSAKSRKRLQTEVARLREELMAEEIVSLPTQKVHKLRFRLHA